MIWIIGEYAERIDNAAELLESFLEGFQDENSQVCILWKAMTVSIVSLHCEFHLTVANWILESHYCGKAKLISRDSKTIFCFKNMVRYF